MQVDLAAIPPVFDFPSLNEDLQLVVAAGLAPDDLLALACTCSALLPVARAESLWVWHARDLASEHSRVKLGRRPGEPAFEYFLNLRDAVEELVVDTSYKTI